MKPLHNYLRSLWYYLSIDANKSSSLFQITRFNLEHPTFLSISYAYFTLISTFNYFQNHRGKNVLSQFGRFPYFTTGVKNRRSDIDVLHIH